MAARASGIKDAMVVPIIKHIASKGKALRSAKLPNGNNTFINIDTGNETRAQDGSDPTQVNPDLMDIDESGIDDLVRSSPGNILYTHVSQVETATPEDIQQHNMILDVTHEAEKLASASIQENMGQLSEPEIQVMLGEELEALMMKSGINLLIGMPGMSEICIDCIFCS